MIGTCGAVGHNHIVEAGRAYSDDRTHPLLPPQNLASTCLIGADSGEMQLEGISVEQVCSDLICAGPWQPRVEPNGPSDAIVALGEIGLCEPIVADVTLGDGDVGWGDSDLFSTGDRVSSPMPSSSSTPRSSNAPV